MKVMLAGALFALNAVLNLALMLALARVMPAEAYGALATWTAAALLVATAMFDWVRFSAMRFYTPGARARDPGVRATLDAAFMLSAAPCILVVLSAAVWRWLPGLSYEGAAVLALLTIGNAGSEYLAALARTRLEGGAYARLIGLRHVATFGIALPVAAAAGDPLVAMLALSVAVWPSVVYGGLALRDRDAAPSLAAKANALRFAAYGLPLISAEAMFQGVSLINRSWLAMSVDFAAAGIYALTFDLAFKVLAVVASVCEASLFPRLVARHEARGDDEAATLITRNIALMLLLMVPAGVAFWVLAEPFANLVLQPGFRPGFNAAIGTALVCAALYTSQTYVLRPAFQIGLRTMPLLQAAALALVIDVAVLFVLRPEGVEGVVRAHGAGLAGGFALLLLRCLMRERVSWPMADTLKIAVSAAAMLFIGRWAMSLTASAPLALLSASLGMGGGYLAVAFLADAAGMRRLALTWWRAQPS